MVPKMPSSTCSPPSQMVHSTCCTLLSTPTLCDSSMLPSIPSLASSIYSHDSTSSSTKSSHHKSPYSLMVDFIFAFIPLYYCNLSLPVGKLDMVKELLCTPLSTTFSDGATRHPSNSCNPYCLYKKYPNKLHCFRIKQATFKWHLAKSNQAQAKV